jgi:hypothetical protein
MNVLILTPDRVGSTLLQRLITVYMTAHSYDKPVINLHELTNGLMKYYSPTFNQEVLGKPNDGKAWGYYQSLNEITELLNSVDHYKTSRLANYHIKNRADTIADQIPFYKYLNDNFYIISARRDNLFEHALSWCIYNESKRLNVYSHQQKIDTFSNIYKNKITINTGILINYMFIYKEYIEWVDRHFTVNSYFKYDQDLARIEDYILNLSIFNNQPQKKNWKEIFKIDFNDWNRCHYLISDISGIGKQLTNHQEKLQLTFDSTQPTTQLQLQSLSQAEITQSLTVADQKFLLDNAADYKRTSNAIQELVDHKVLTTPVPIKLQTMLEKKLLVKNFDECVEAYNKVMTDPHSLIKGLGTPYNPMDIDNIVTKEIGQWHTLPRLT